VFSFAMPDQNRSDHIKLIGELNFCQFRTLSKFYRKLSWLKKRK
jgi:hypothetical protein